MSESLTRNETYEDQFGRPKRWILRLWRPIVWHIRGFFGQPRHLLVELRWRLGDELMALPVLAALRARYPREYITLLSNFPELFVKQQVADSVNLLPPRVDRYLLMRGAPRQVERLAHYAARAGIPRPDLSPRLSLPSLPSQWADRLPAGSGPLIALAPGASWPNKRWLPQHWAILAKLLAADGARLLVLGHGDEPIPGDWISLIDQTSVFEAGQILARATLLVACDSGLMHLALAVGTPTVALFGPTDPRFLSNSPLLYPVISKEKCAGYWNHADHVPPPGNCACGHISCIESISPQHVAQLTRQILSL